MISGFIAQEVNYFERNLCVILEYQSFSFHGLVREEDLYLDENKEKEKQYEEKKRKKMLFG